MQVLLTILIYIGIFSCPAQGSEWLVRGNSMNPCIENGDKIDTEEPIDINVGDVVIFRKEKFIMHRVWWINNKGYLTKGDHNNYFDGYTKDILRKVKGGR